MRLKRKIRLGRVCFLILITTLLITGVYKTVGHSLPLIINSSSESIVSRLRDSNLLALVQAETQPPLSLDSTGRQLYSPYAILVNLPDQSVVFETRSEERISPASLTKIMTALVAIENIADLQAPIILPKQIFPDLSAANASMAGFLPGEEVPALDLLYGTLLPSGADASLGLALQVAHSERDFVQLMNQKAQQLGMEDTHFTNVSGLYEDNHYTTVKDIARLLNYALKNKTFREVFTSMQHSTASTNLHPGGITFYSTMFTNMNTPEFAGGRILGGKTGYTGKSGLCLASLAEKNGTEYILVTAGAAGNHYTEQYNILDALTIYEDYLNK